MNKWRALVLFQKKIFIPSLTTAAVIGACAGSIPEVNIFISIGVAYAMTTPLFHYFIYDVRKPNEYYFYYNMGFSKIALWASTAIPAFVILIISLSL